jgi:hypothetical protein
MQVRSGDGGILSILRTVVPAAVLLGGCALTTVTSSSNPSRAAASAWADYDTLPVELHGVVPGETKAQLAALFPPYHAPQYAALGDLPRADTGRRMVLFVNPVAALPRAELCEGRGRFERAVQQGRSAYVQGALCDGGRVISTASGYVLTRDMTPKELSHDFATIRDQLYQSLFPGANNPDMYFN